MQRRRQTQPKQTQPFARTNTTAAALSGLVCLAACARHEEPAGAPLKEGTFWLDTPPEEQARLFQFVVARRRSPEFEEATRATLLSLCSIERPKDKGLQSLMREWPIEAIFPYIPMLDIRSAGCGTYKTRQGQTITLPLRSWYNAQARLVP